MNYTKGEWKILPVLVDMPYMDERIQHYYITGEINGNPDRTIADVGCWKDRDNALDDARLIIASPIGYELASAILAQEQDGLDRSEKIIELAHYFINKAESK